MSRKNPSSHSDDQFALFVMSEGLEAIDQARFRDMVRRLICKDAETPATEPEDPETIFAAEPIVTNGAAQGHGLNGDHAGATTTAVAVAMTPIDGSQNEGQERTPGPPELLPLISKLVFQWSNSQRLLIHLLALMLETDESSAAVVFSALSTTHLRIDLIRRLALLKVGDRQTRQELNKIIDDFDDAGRVQNEVIHAMYRVNEQGEITHTEIMCFVSNENGGMTFGESQAIDQQRVRDVVAACDNLRLLGKTLGDLIPRLEKEIEA